MVAEYKKRAKKGYNSDKEQSNRDERQYEKELISELVENPEPTTTIPKKKLKPNSDLERTIKLALTEIRYVVKMWKSEEGLREYLHNTERSWIRDFLNRYLSRWKPNVKLLKAYKNSDLVSKKYKRQIVEILEMIGESNG